MSYIERTARKLFPILNEVKRRMIPEKKRNMSSQRSGRVQKRPLRNGKQGGLITLDPCDVEIEDSEEEQMLIDLATENMGIKVSVDLKNILGYLNQGEWTSKLSIGSIMQL